MIDFKTLYESLFEDGKEWRNNCKYEWEYKITQDEYKEITEALRINKSVGELDRCINREINRETNDEDCFCLKLLQIYLAEFYKREYDGRNVNDIIGYECLKDHYRDIFNANVINLYFHQNNRYLDSMFVNGGLPLNDAPNKEYINKLGEILRNTDDSDDEINDISGEISDAFGNIALAESYKKREGVYEFIERLKISVTDPEQYPFAGEDKDNEPFIKFIGRLRRAFKQSLKYKMKLEFRMWQYQDDFVLTPIIRFRPEYSNKGRHEVISRERLYSWGIKNPSNIFDIIVRDNKNSEIGRMTYCLCAKGDYREFYGRSEYKLKPIRKENLTWDYLCSVPSIYYKGRNSSKEKLISLEKNDLQKLVKSDEQSLEFYSNDGCVWSTVKRGDKEAKIEKSNNANGGWKWKEIDENNNEETIEIHAQENVQERTDFLTQEYEKNDIYVAFDKTCEEKHNFTLIRHLYSKVNNSGERNENADADFLDFVTNYMEYKNYSLSKINKSGLQSMAKEFGVAVDDDMNNIINAANNQEEFLYKIFDVVCSSDSNFSRLNSIVDKSIQRFPNNNFIALVIKYIKYKNNSNDIDEWVLEPNYRNGLMKISEGLEMDLASEMQRNIDSIINRERSFELIVKDCLVKILNSYAEDEIDFPETIMGDSRTRLLNSFDFMSQMVEDRQICIETLGDVRKIIRKMLKFASSNFRFDREYQDDNYAQIINTIADREINIDINNIENNTCFGYRTEEVRLERDEIECVAITVRENVKDMIKNKLMQLLGLQ